MDAQDAHRRHRAHRDGRRASVRTRCGTWDVGWERPSGPIFIFHFSVRQVCKNKKRSRAAERPVTRWSYRANPRALRGRLQKCARAGHSRRAARGTSTATSSAPASTRRLPSSPTSRRRRQRRAGPRQRRRTPDPPASRRCPRRRDADVPDARPARMRPGDQGVGGNHIDSSVCKTGGALGKSDDDRGGGKASTLRGSVLLSSDRRCLRIRSVYRVAARPSR